MDNQSVQALQDFKQTPVMDFTDNEISSNSNIIPYSQYLQETQQETVQDTNLQAQQDLMILSLDLELVPKENRFDIIKCNGRIPRGFSQREPTFQVTLDAIALTTCFLITADVPEVYMHQFWNSLYKHDDFYRFKIEKKKRFKLTLEVFRDIF
ncbi:hypothetical protein Tco_0672183 [Tanacetum coccineum]